MTSQLEAEIDAGVLDNKSSLFSLLEQGLRRNPHGSAIVCLHEAADQLQDLLATTFHERSNDEAVNTEYLTVTYTQLHQTALRLAAGLLANGVSPGSTLLMLVPNGGHYALLLWTCIIARLTFVSLDPIEALDDSEALRTRNRSILQEARPDVVVVPGAAESEAMDIIMGGTGIRTPLKISLTNTGEPKCKFLASLASDGDAQPIDEEAMVEEARHDDPNRLCSVMFTSGTSESPKGCPLLLGGVAHMLRSWSWLINQSNCSHVLQQAHNSRGIAPVQTLQTWSEGGAVLMTGRGFHVPDMLDAIRLEHATFIVLTPSMVHSLGSYLETLPEDLTSVRTVQVGGDAVTRSVLSKCMSIFPHAKVCINHGMTEGGACFEWPFFENAPSDIPYFGQVCPIGKPARGAAVRIWDYEKRCVTARGRAGELHLSSNSIIGAYLHGESASSFYSENDMKWFITGDVAMMTDDGIVYILGRSRDMMRCNDHVIMPFVIESYLEHLTGAQATVVAIPHPLRGQTPHAVLSTFDQKSESDIQEAVICLLGKHYELGGVASLEMLDLTAFPVNGTRKVIRTQIKTAVLCYLNKGREE